MTNFLASLSSLFLLLSAGLGSANAMAQPVPLAADQLQLINAMVQGISKIGPTFFNLNGRALHILQASVAYDAASNTANYFVVSTLPCSESPTGSCGPLTFQISTQATVTPNARKNRALTAEETQLLLAFGHEIHSLDLASQLEGQALSGTISHDGSDFPVRQIADWVITFGKQRCNYLPTHLPHCVTEPTGTLKVSEVRNGLNAPSYNSSVTR